MADKLVSEVNKGGRPRKYDTPQKMIDKIDAYFDECESNNKPRTVSGLCIYLDLTNETLLQYEKLSQFSESIKKAKKKVENYVEEGIMSGKVNTVGGIFNLKNNFNWRDKIDHDINSSMDINITLTNSDDE